MTSNDGYTVWKILVEECGAPDSIEMSTDFAINWPRCVEFRFQGNLGFGGKVWSNGQGAAPYVTYYAEDETPERRHMMFRANQRLKELADR